MEDKGMESNRDSYRLIIIDDEPKILDGLSNIFPWEKVGFHVDETFTSARKAVSYLENHPADVVLSDIEMPDMTGIELSRKLMDREDVLLVFFSSYKNYEYFRAAIQNHVFDYLLKPVNYAGLLECFEKVKKKLDEQRKIQEEIPREYYAKIVYEVKRYIQTHLQEPTLEEAAEMVMLSPNYLSKIFKEHSGQSFSDTVLFFRMEKACEMLKDDQYKGYDIAYYLGYDNPKNFSRAFKAFYNMSPSEYRNQKMGKHE